MIMRKVIIVALAALIISLVLVSSSFAQDTLLISYQGRLTDDGGEPLTGSYDITFGIYAMPSGSSLLWSETHSDVSIVNGLFSVILGSQTALPDTVFIDNDRYLGITIGEDPEISPRVMLTSCPSAAIAKSIKGDIETGAGSMLIKTENGDSAFVFDAGISKGASRFTMYLMEPLHKQPMIQMNTGPDLGGLLTFYNMDPLDKQPLVEIGAGTATGGTINIYDEIGQVMGFEPTPFNEGYAIKFIDPEDAKNMLSISGNHINNKAKITFIEPGNDGVTPAMEMATDPDGSYFHMNGYDEFQDMSYDGFRVDLDNVNKITSMKLIEPGNDYTPGFELTASGLTNGATFKMIEPGDDGVNPAIEMATDLSGSYLHLNGYDEAYNMSYNGFVVDLDNVNKITSMKLIEPGNDNTPGFEFSASGLTNASQFNVLDPADHGRSLVEMNGSLSGGSIYMFNPQPEPPARLFGLEVNIAKSSDDIIMDLTSADSLYQTKITPGRVKVGHPITDSYPRSELNAGADTVSFFLQGLSAGAPAPAIGMMSSSGGARMGIGTLIANEPLVVGTDLGNFSGDRIVIGDNTDGVQPGLVIGESNNFRGYLLWDVDDNYLSLGTRQNSITYGNTISIKEGRVGINTTSPTTDFYVVGDICYTGSIGACSDRRYKKDISTLTNAIEKLSQMRGVRFNWRQDEYPECRFSDKSQVGFVAQELVEVVPEVVSQDNSGYYNIDYSKVTPLLVEAIKEQQRQIERQRNLIEDLSNRLKQLESIEVSEK